MSGSIPLDGWGGFSVAVVGDTVYVSEYRSASQSARLRVVDASNVAEMTTVRLIDTDDVAFQLASLNGQLIAFETSRVRLYELADPTGKRAGAPCFRRRRLLLSS